MEKWEVPARVQPESSERQQRTPTGKRNFLEHRSTLWNHRAPSVLVQLPGLYHMGPSTVLAGHLAQIASLLVKSSPSYLSAAENWPSFRNFETMVVTVSPLLMIWIASSLDSRAEQGVQTLPGQRGHSSSRKPRLEGEAAHPPLAQAGLCQGGLQAQLPAGE